MTDRSPLPDRDTDPANPEDIAPRAGEVDDADRSAGNDLGVDDPTADDVGES